MNTVSAVDYIFKAYQINTCIDIVRLWWVYTVALPKILKPLRKFPCYFAPIDRINKVHFATYKAKLLLNNVPLNNEDCIMYGFITTYKNNDKIMRYDAVSVLNRATATFLYKGFVLSVNGKPYSKYSYEFGDYLNEQYTLFRIVDHKTFGKFFETASSYEIQFRVHKINNKILEKIYNDKLYQLALMYFKSAYHPSCTIAHYIIDNHIPRSEYEHLREISGNIYQWTQQESTLPDLTTKQKIYESPYCDIKLYEDQNTREEYIVYEDKVIINKYGLCETMAKIWSFFRNKQPQQVTRSASSSNPTTSVVFNSNNNMVRSITINGVKKSIENLGVYKIANAHFDWGTAKCIMYAKLLNNTRIATDGSTKFRCDKMVPQRVYIIRDGQFIEEFPHYVTSEHDPNFKYYINQLAEEPRFDTRKDKVCVKGLHFCITAEDVIDYIGTKEMRAISHIPNLEDPPPNYKGKEPMESPPPDYHTLRFEDW